MVQAPFESHFDGAIVKTRDIYVKWQTMKNVVVFLAFACSNALHVVTASEPGIVLLTTKETQVYQTNHGQIELKERRIESVLHGDNQERPLQELEDRWRLKAAHVANFLDCGQDVVASEPLKTWTQQRIDELGEDDRWSRLVVKPVNESYVIVAERDGARAVVLNRETGQRLPGSPCGAAVKIVRVSPNGRRLAVIAEKNQQDRVLRKKRSQLARVSCQCVVRTGSSARRARQSRDHVKPGAGSSGSHVAGRGELVASRCQSQQWLVESDELAACDRRTWHTAFQHILADLCSVRSTDQQPPRRFRSRACRGTPRYTT